MPSIPTMLAHRLRKLCKAAKLTRYALAKRAGVTPEMVGRIESGERTCKWETACKLADALGVSVQEFRTRSRPI